MRNGISLLLVLVVGVAVGTAEPEREGGRRFGIAPELETYPQGTPKEALASVLKAIDARRFDYLVAQLADPAFIDDRLERLYSGRFEQQVEDTRVRLDLHTVKLLRRFLQEGTWTTAKTARVFPLEILRRGTPTTLSCVVR